MESWNTTILAVNSEESWNINEVCRLCFVRKTNMNSWMEENVPELLLECADIQLTANDELFNFICLECKEELAAFCEFRRRIVNVYKAGCNLIEEYFKDEEAEKIEELSNCVVTVFGGVDEEDSQEDEEQEKIVGELLEEKEDGSIKAGDSVCLVCSKAFRSYSALNGHMQWHSLELPKKPALYDCGTCGRAFGRKQTLERHMARHLKAQKKEESSEPRKYLCTFCGEIFNTYSSFKGHTKFKHIRHKRYKCEHCDEAFIAKNQLDNHVRKHTGMPRRIVRKCEQCGKGCANATEMRVHMRFHTGERPFKCDLCDRSFIIKGNLTTHRRMHTGEKPFKCRYCPKGFRETSSLKVHERVHTGERPYPCTVCKKSFHKSYNLSVHLRTHAKNGSKKKSVEDAEKKIKVLVLNSALMGEVT